MKSIYACKLYKSSKHKDKIHAALEDVTNVELVKQLEEYLDDEYKPLTKIGDDAPDDSSVEEVDKSESDDGRFDAPHTGGGMSHSTPSGGSLSEKYGDELDAEGAEKFDATQVDGDEESDSAEEATASTHISKKSVLADTSVGNSMLCGQVLHSGLAGELKGTLNMRSATSGVLRVAAKGDEVWVYYNDDTNLNNIMSPVIELLNAANYGYLVFNRLARTDNAMVFTISTCDTSNSMEYVQNE